MSHLAQFRTEKDAYFGGDSQSPLTEKQRAAFEGLAYFEEASNLELRLTPNPVDNHDPVELAVTTGGTTTTRRWATICFKIDGVPAVLTIFRESEDGPFFLPFRDGTAGEETYGVGRYVDVHELPEGRVLVDFNYAYNPYCAYNGMWSCPVPPAENRIAVPIRAGEQAYPDAEH